MTNPPPPHAKPRQLLHLVFGGELEDLQGVAFRDPAKLDIVRQHIDADRRLVIGVELVEHAAARERGLADADVP